MISGTMRSSKAAVVRLIALGTEGRIQEIDALVDTGFTGELTLPPETVVSLDLAFHGRTTGVLADGTERLLHVFEAAVLWGNQERRIAVYAADATPLLGMGLLYGHELNIQVVEAGNVSIRALPLS
jgi:clan AA aspartic protease